MQRIELTLDDLMGTKPKPKPPKEPAPPKVARVPIRRGPPPTYAEVIQKELESGTADYSPEAGWLRARQWCLTLLEELGDCLASEDVPADVNFQDVGNLAAIRVHLEKSVAHARRYVPACLNCPIKSDYEGEE